jgi:hypothetical protein
MDSRRLSLALVVGVAVIGPPAAAPFLGLPADAAEERVGAGQAFVAGFEDLPLMPGLTQILDAGVVFDTPSGRIIEAYAEGPVGREEVAAFYARTLPQLGWQAVRGTQYLREGERLRVEISGGEESQAGVPVTVRFYLLPD